jgi:hypothetical protein
VPIQSAAQYLAIKKDVTVRPSSFHPAASKTIERKTENIPGPWDEVRNQARCMGWDSKAIHFFSGDNEPKEPRK